MTIIGTPSLDQPQADAFACDAFPLRIVRSELDGTVGVSADSVVVNLGAGNIRLADGSGGVLAPRTSTILTDCALTADFAAIVGIPSTPPDAAQLRDEWADFYGGRVDAPLLLRSPVVEAGHVVLDQRALLHRDSASSAARRFRVTLNLWFSPAGTDCGVHREHDFVEVHTQLTGVGRMQKFRTRELDSRYEDQPMAPGTTNPVPFCDLISQAFVYPWHQYRADTDCVWLAVEYHLD